MNPPSNFVISSPNNFRTSPSNIPNTNPDNIGGLNPHNNFVLGSPNDFASSLNVNNNPPSDSHQFHCDILNLGTQIEDQHMHQSSQPGG